LSTFQRLEICFLFKVNSHLLVNIFFVYALWNYFVPPLLLGSLSAATKNQSPNLAAKSPTALNCMKYNTNPSCWWLRTATTLEEAR